MGKEAPRAWHAVEHHLLDQLSKDWRRPRQLKRARRSADRAVVVTGQRILREQLDERLPEDAALAAQQRRPLRHEPTIGEAVGSVVVAQKLVSDPGDDRVGRGHQLTLSVVDARWVP